MLQNTGTMQCQHGEQVLCRSTLAMALEAGLGVVSVEGWAQVVEERVVAGWAATQEADLEVAVVANWAAAAAVDWAAAWVADSGVASCSRATRRRLMDRQLASRVTAAARLCCSLSSGGLPVTPRI